MPTQFTAQDGATRPLNDGVAFAPTPVWERGNKRRGSGPRPASRDPAIDSGEPAAWAAPEPADAAYESQPFSYQAIRADDRSGGGRRAGLIVAGVAALAIVGAVGWYVNRPQQGGVAELTPGVPVATPMALAAAPPAPAQPSMASAPTPAPVAPPAATAAPASEAATHVRAASASPAPRASVARPHAGDTSEAQAATARENAAAARVRPADANSALESSVTAGASTPMVTPPPPRPSGGTSTGPAVDTPTERVAPGLDPTPSQAQPGTGLPSPSSTAPTGDVTTP